MALTRLDGVAAGHSVLMVCSGCGHRELCASRHDGLQRRAHHERTVHGIPARVSAGAAAVRKARQRARALATNAETNAGT